MDALLALNQAHDYESFRNALRSWVAPLQNFVYADLGGNIAYQMAGRVPVRAAGSGRLPLPAWDDTYSWDGFVPFDDMPAVSNPPAGFIVAANNPAVRPRQTEVEERTYASGYRAKRISELLEQLILRGQLTSADNESIQSDVRSLFYQDLLPHLKGIPESEFSGESGARARRAREVLLQWDGHMDAESGAAALFAVFFERLASAAFADEFGEDRWSLFHTGRSVDTTQNSLVHLLKDAENTWWDDTETITVVETSHMILVRALAEAYEELAAMVGAESEWRWGDLHTVTFESPAFPRGSSRAAFALLARGPRAVDGGLNQVNRASFALNTGYGVTHLVSARVILDMADLSDARFVHTTGQSGHAGSEFYDDLIDDWADGVYHSLHWTRSDVEELPVWIRLDPDRR